MTFCYFYRKAAFLGSSKMKFRTLGQCHTCHYNAEFNTQKIQEKNAQITGEFILDFHKEPAVQILPALPLAGIAASECSEIKLIFATN